MPDQLEGIIKTLLNNKDKGFVKRILTPNDYPKLQNSDGSYSTHSMAYGNVDNQNIVYPTVFHDTKANKLVRYNGREAIDNAMKTGNFIPMETPEAAENFSKNYKQYWDASGHKY